MALRDNVTIIYDDGHPVKHRLRQDLKDGEIVEKSNVLVAEDWSKIYHAAIGMIESLRVAPCHKGREQ